MSADDLLQTTSEALFFGIFVLVLVAAIRRPRRATIDTALMFGAIAVIVVIGWVRELLSLPTNATVEVLSGALLIALPYLLLRLLDDFAGVPWPVMRTAELGLVLSTAALIVLPTPLSLEATVLIVLYLVAFSTYASGAFVREARRTSGVTRRRMQAVAAGSLSLGLVILVAGLQALLPMYEGVLTAGGHVLGLATGVSYALGFAPPSWLRRAWQEPELRAFLGRAAHLPRLPNTESILAELEAGAAASFGAPSAAIGLWDEAEQVLRYRVNGEQIVRAAGRTLGGSALAEQRAILSFSVDRDDPDHAEWYRRFNTRALLAAPITAGARRLGVIVVYAPRAPIFAEDDLVLVQLLADQAAVVLESRALIDEASRVRAREEATRLKDDFLSSAAHDLRTPLTTLIAQAQLLERRAVRRPEDPADLVGIRRLIGEGRRLNRLVTELLDASRLEQGRLLESRERVDLVEVAIESCSATPDTDSRCVVDAPEAVVGQFDRVRIRQLFDNLIENALKYSPDGGEVRVTVRGDEREAVVTVQDHGIGIPAADLSNVFDRFHRGSNVDDRQFAGMGLGLFICRGIVEQHGGRLTVSSAKGQGSTFRFMLPVAAADEAIESPRM